jgi:two-component system cell cycle response regulator
MHDNNSKPIAVRKLLELSILIEPDRQRLMRFAIEAVESLGGNVFAASRALLSAVDRCLVGARQGRPPVNVELTMSEACLSLGWDEEWYPLVELGSPPPAAVVDELAGRLKLASEQSDPELLSRRNREINEELNRFVATAAEQMAELEATIERKKKELQESVRRAETDSLTGLFNRGAYDQRLRESVLHCQRQGEPLSLILLDLDKFKEINDTHGHQYGDEYLKRMARAMCAATREHVDLPCRMGGDEFAIVVFADGRIAERVAQQVLEGMQGKVSIGVAELMISDTPDSLVGRADAALYDAKRGGRGQVATAVYAAAVNI